MIKHRVAIEALNALSKVSVTQFDPKDYARSLNRETDRVHMILSASIIDDLLLAWIKTDLRGADQLRSDDRSRLYGFDGPLGTFGGRTLFALAMGIIDRTARKQIDIMRSIRNAAAHAHGAIDYSTEGVRKGLMSIVEDQTTQQLMAKWDDLAFRKFHGLLGAGLGRLICSDESGEINIKLLFESIEADFQERRKSSPAA